MTKNRAAKQAVREHMAATGEKYTEARREIVGEAADLEGNASSIVHEIIDAAIYLQDFCAYATDHSGDPDVAAISAMNLSYGDAMALAASVEMYDDPAAGLDDFLKIHKAAEEYLQKLDEGAPAAQAALKAFQSVRDEVGEDVIERAIAGYAAYYLEYWKGRALVDEHGWPRNLQQPSRNVSAICEYMGHNYGLVANVNELLAAFRHDADGSLHMVYEDDPEWEGLGKLV